MSNSFSLPLAISPYWGLKHVCHQHEPFVLNSLDKHTQTCSEHNINSISTIFMAWSKHLACFKASWLATALVEAMDCRQHLTTWSWLQQSNMQSHLLKGLVTMIRSTNNLNESMWNVMWAEPTQNGMLCSRWVYPIAIYIIIIIVIIMYVHYCMISPLNITVCVSIALFLCGPGSLVMLQMKWGLFNWLKLVGHMVLNTSWKRG